jgi:predicted nucleotidyltransferase
LGKEELLDRTVSPEGVIRALGDFLSERCAGQGRILAVYLFGSRARKDERPASDIDLGFLFDPREYVRDRMEALLIAETLGHGASEMLGLPVDVTVLNACALGFVHQVLQDAITVYDADPGGRICFEVFVENEYHDFAPFPEEANRGHTSDTGSVA